MMLSRSSSSFMAFVVGVSCLATTDLATTRVWADKQDPAAADALFRDARALLKDKKYDQACPKLAESYRLDPAPGTLYNLAECEEARGRVATAGERWQGLVDQLTLSGKLTDERLKVAREHVAALSPRIPKLELRLKPGSPTEVAVVRDGVELRGASLGVALPVDPGDHTILVRGAYRKDVETKVSLREGETKKLELEVGPEDGTRPSVVVPKPTATTSASPAPTPTSSTGPAPTTTATAGTDPTPPGTSTRRKVGYVVGGVGVASLLGAGITGIILLGKHSTVNDPAHCNAAKQCDSEGADAAKSGKTLVPVNAVLWGVGLVGVGLGTYLIISGKSSDEAHTAVGAVPVPGGGGVELTGRF